MTETRIRDVNISNVNYDIPGYTFQFVPTAGGVGMYIDTNLNYYVLEKTSNEAFQALWIEILFPTKKNITCCVIYRQHNSPERFQAYFDEKVELYASMGRHLFIVGDFNIDMLKIGHCNYAHNFLLSLQSCSLFPSIDKPTRVYGNSATLIDNIFISNPDELLYSGNVVSDLSDHYSQFCVMNSNAIKYKTQKQKIRDYSRFSEATFKNELSQIDWSLLIQNASDNPDKLFSTFYNKLNKVVNKHAPLKPISKRKVKQMSKPWITKGIRRLIKIKNELFYSGNNWQNIKLIEIQSLL